METLNKARLVEMKQDIKQLVAAQIADKKQMHQPHHTVQNISSIQYNVWGRTSQLRYMYLAYGLMRGRTIEQIESKSKTQADKSTIDHYIKKYS